MKKGRNVAVQGRIQTGVYTAEDGQKKYTFNIEAERVQFIDWGDRAQKPAATQGFGSFDTGMDDGFDLPFQDASDEEIPFLIIKGDKNMQRKFRPRKKSCCIFLR